MTAEQANQRIKTCGYLNGMNITVSQEKKLLVITGKVRTFYHKQLAQEALMQASKGVRLRNDLEVG